MLNQSQQARIARRFTSVLLQAIDAFPELLARSEPEAAASIVADLMKTQLTRPPAEPEEDPALTLAALVRSIADEPPPPSPQPLPAAPG